MSAPLAVMAGLGITVVLVTIVECCTRAIERRNQDPTTKTGRITK
jgi:hypothetical protein